MSGILTSRKKDWIKSKWLAVLMLGFLACDHPVSKRPISLFKDSSFSISPEALKGDSLISSLRFRSSSAFYGFGLIKGKDSLYYKLFLLQGKDPAELLSKKIKNIGKVLAVESSTIKDTAYVFLQYLGPNKRPDNLLYFALLNPRNGALYPIHYRYNKDFFNLSAKFQAPDSLKKFGSLIAELSKKAARYVFQEKIAKNGNPNSRRDSLTKRWVMLNDRAYDEVSQPNGTFKLNTEEVSEDLSPSLYEYENNDSLFKKNVNVAENGQYRISALKEGPVYGFQKSSKKTFLLWVPDEPAHFIKSVQLKGNRVLFYDSLLTPKSKLKPIYEFDLGQRIIKKIK